MAVICEEVQEEDKFAKKKLLVSVRYSRYWSTFMFPITFGM